MENKNLQLIDLTVEELIYLSSFAKTTKYYNIPKHTYHYGTYAEECICITKNKEGKWEVYIIERGNIYNKSTFENCLDACLQLIKYGTRTIEEEIEMIDHYLKEALKMKNSLKQLEEKEIIPEVNNILLQLKKSKK